MQPESKSDELLSGTVRLVEPGSAGDLRILPYDDVGVVSIPFRGEQAFQVNPLTDWVLHDRATPFQLPSDAKRYALGISGSAGSMTFKSTPTLTVSGPALLWLYGGTYQVEAADGGKRVVHTGEQFNASRSATDPSGQAGERWFDRVVILVEADKILTNLTGGANSPVEVATLETRGRWEGDLAFAGVEGNITADGTPLAPKSGLLQAIGAFDGHGNFSSQSSSTWKLTGKASFVGVDGATVSGVRPGHRIPPGFLVAGSLSLAAALAAVLTHVGRECLTFITGRNVAKPLESNMRLKFLRAVAESPGLTVRDLSARFGMSKLGAYHHIRILKRANYLDEVRRGNVATYMLNSHSFRFFATGVGQGEAASARVNVAAAMAELGHPKRRLIFNALKENGSLDYDGLVRAWQQQGIPPPHPTPWDVSYHAAKMRRAGLLARTRKGKQAWWSLNLDLAQLQEHQRASYLKDGISQAVLGALAASADLSLQDLLHAVSKRLAGQPLEAAKERIAVLVQTGIVVKSQEGKYRLGSYAWK